MSAETEPVWRGVMLRAAEAWLDWGVPGAWLELRYDEEIAEAERLVAAGALDHGSGSQYRLSAKGRLALAAAAAPHGQAGRVLMRNLRPGRSRVRRKGSR